MLGHRTNRFKLFNATDIEALVPADHFYRQLEEKLEPLLQLKPAATTVSVGEESKPRTRSCKMTSTGPESRTWSERIEIAGGELVDRVKKLVEEGNVRRVIIRTSNDDFRLEIPLTAGVAVGGVLTVLAPVLAALGALAALVAQVNLEIVRSGEKEEGDGAGDNPA